MFILLKVTRKVSSIDCQITSNKILLLVKPQWYSLLSTWTKVHLSHCKYIYIYLQYIYIAKCTTLSFPSVHSLMSHQVWSVHMSIITSCSLSLCYKSNYNWWTSALANLSCHYPPVIKFNPPSFNLTLTLLPNQLITARKLYSVQLKYAIHFSIQPLPVFLYVCGLGHLETLQWWKGKSHCYGLI